MKPKTMLKPTHEIELRNGREFMKRLPESPPTWLNVRVHRISSGQPGPYKDSVDVADILLEGGSQSAFDGLDSPFFFKIGREQVKTLVATLVQNFTPDGQGTAYSSRLQSLEIIDEGPAHRVWRAVVVTPYSD
jgi:hypothetical protein